MLLRHNSYFLGQGKWTLKHKRLFYDGIRRRVIWWKNLTEIFLINAQTRHHLEPKRLDVSSKLRVIHGLFTAYLCYSQEKNFVSMVVYQHTLSSYVLFTLKMDGKRRELILNNFGGMITLHYYLSIRSFLEILFICFLD